MRPIICLASSLVVAIALPLCTWGQRVPYQPDGPFTGFDVLLLTESVQQELKLSLDQLRQIKELARAVRLKRRSEFENRGYRTEDRVEKARAMLRAVSDETIKGVAQYLKPDQLKRLKQIHVQWLGLQAFFEPELQAALALRPEQKQELEKISQQLQDSSSKAVQAGNRKTVEPKLQTITNLRRQALAQAVGLLSPPQKQTWLYLTGTPFQPPALGPSRLPAQDKPITAGRDAQARSSLPAVRP
jgi:hypothetical protein